MAEINITLDILKQYPKLQEDGVLPGDKLVDGELVRVYSDGSLSNPQGLTLTDEMIGQYPNLQRDGAKPGDKIVDGELVDMEELGTMRQAMLGFDESGNDITNLGDWITAKTGFDARLFYEGKLLGTAEDIYGEGFSEADVETRKQMIMDKRARALIEDYGYSQVLDTEQTGARTAGSIGKLLFTPTTLAPVGKTVQAGVAIGAGLGASNVLLEQLAKGEEVDLEQVATTGAIGGVLGGGLAKAGSVFRNMKQDSIVRGANNIIDRTNAATKKGVDDGLKGKELRDFVVKTTQISDDDLAKATNIAQRGVDIPLPGSKIAAEAKIDDIIENGGAAATRQNGVLERVFGVLSTRIKNIDEGAFFRLRQYEYKIHTKTQKALDETKGFFKGMKKLTPSVKQKASVALFNGDKLEFNRLVADEAPNLITEYNRVRKVLSGADGKGGLAAELKGVGYTFDEIENYFPRVVKDYEGLIGTLGRERQGIIDSSLKTVAAAKGKSVGTLTPTERSAVIDQVMRGKRAVFSKSKDKPIVRYIPFEVKEPGIANTKKRTITKISEDQEQFYYSPEEALFSYINKAVNDIEKREFFGQSIAKTVDGVVDTEKSIGNLVDEARAAGKINRAQELDLTDMLNARFVGGAQTPDSIIQFLRDSGYIATIANPFSAIVQLGDIAASGALKGLKNTLGALFGTKELDVIELGIAQATEELVSPNRAADFLNKMLKWSQFSRLDRLGKNTIINASIRQARGLAKSAKGRDKLRSKYGKAFGSEFDSFVDDLQTGRMSENVKFYAFNEISDMQPVSLSEMPQAYLNNPNGRVLYMLKSFMIKQYDVVRREVIQEFNKADTLAGKAAAVKKGAALFGYLAVGNAGTGMLKDMALQREVDVDQIPDRALWSLLGIYGANKYTADRYLSQGDFVGAFVNQLAPAAPLIDAAFRGAADVVKGEADEDTVARLVKPVPVVGMFAYNWLLGGAEKYNESQNK
jgi:hypothetical protein